MQLNNPITLANNVSNQTQSTTYPWRGGKGTFTAEATWTQGSVSLTFQSLNGTMLPVAGTNLGANGVVGFDLPAGQIGISFSGLPTAVYAYVIGGNY